MSLRCFQSALARLASEPGFRQRVRRRGTRALGPGLTARERLRLRRLARDRGLDVTAVLINSFRLGKILVLLPLTRTLLGDERLAGEVRRFWKARPPTSFYALEEALDFCDHLRGRLARGWRVAYLADVVGFERAMLELRRVRPANETPPPQEVRFRYDPGQTLTALAAGRRPRRARVRHCVLVAAAENETVLWSRGGSGLGAEAPHRGPGA